MRENLADSLEGAATGWLIFEDVPVEQYDELLRVRVEQIHTLDHAQRETMLRLFNDRWEGSWDELFATARDL